jgi:Skp family chaperone for outer membrane proteins
MKTIVFVAIATVLPGVFLMQASGGNAVAVIDFERAVSDAPGGKDAITKLTTFRDEQMTAIQNKQKQAAALEDRLRTQGTALNDTTRAQITRDLQAAQTSLETMTNEAEKKLGEMQQELLVPIQRKAAAAVATYATEHSVKIVLDSSVFQNGLVYVNDTADITTEIIRRIAADLKTPATQDASAKIPRLLDRKWLDFTIRTQPATTAGE